MCTYEEERKETKVAISGCIIAQSLNALVYHARYSAIFKLARSLSQLQVLGNE